MKAIHHFKLSFLILFCISSLLGCDQLDQLIPYSEEKIAENYFYAVSEGDIDRAMNMIHVPSSLQNSPTGTENTFANLRRMLDSMKNNFFDDHLGIQSVFFSNKTFSHNNTRVALEYTLVLGDGSSRTGTINLININQRWKIKAL